MQSLVYAESYNLEEQIYVGGQQQRVYSACLVGRDYRNECDVCIPIFRPMVIFVK